MQSLQGRARAIRCNDIAAATKRASGLDAVALPAMPAAQAGNRTVKRVPAPPLD